MVLNEIGKIVENTWYDLPNHNSGIELDAFVAMPNHIHAIIMIMGTGGGKGQVMEPAPTVNKFVGAGSITRPVLKPAPVGTTVAKLSEIVRQLKTFSARRINALRNAPSLPFWQRNYYEHVIRNDQDLFKIREYIQNNPLKWELDPENPYVENRLIAQQ